MELNYESLKLTDEWEKLNIILPKYNIKKVEKNSNENPTWIHFGAGNIFRAFIANRYQDLLDKNIVDTGIIAVESFDSEIIEKVYKPHDNLSLLVAMKANGETVKRVISSVTEVIKSEDKKLSDFVKKSSLQIISFTITEKGYSIKNQLGNFSDLIKQDIENGPNNAKHVMSIVASLLYTRFLNGKAPITLLSLDNCSHNGDKIKEAIITISTEWVVKSRVNKDFIDYLENSVTYPLSMIDKITPRPSNVVQNDLEKLGLKSMDIVITEKGSYMAPFVNAEINEYLVIEDKFANGRPNLENAGIILTDKETVNNVETMKVTTCLNPLHTALAVTGCLLGYNLISEQMKDPILIKLIETIGYKEGLKVVVDPKIISPEQFIKEVITERFPNPAIPDTPQRIATDTSQKVGIRFGITIKKYFENEHLNCTDLVGIPLAIAAWCRYLFGTDDNGNIMNLSPDPLLKELQNHIKSGKIKNILSDQTLFGLDLFKVGLGEKITKYYLEMMSGKGSVYKTLKKYIL